MIRSQKRRILTTPSRSSGTAGGPGPAPRTFSQSPIGPFTPFGEAGLAAAVPLGGATAQPTHARVAVEQAHGHGPGPA